MLEWFTPLPPMPTPLKALCAALLLAAVPAARADSSLGLFTDHGDIGTVQRAGTATYDPATESYSVAASGANMWFTADALQFVWKRVSGDVSLSADITFVGLSKQGHRKACLILRQDLDPGSAYVDVARHGDGLTSLQFRAVAGGVTKEIQSNVVAPRHLRLDKIGDVVYLSVAGDDGVLRPSGASFPLAFKGSFYVGLGVSAHDDNAFETAVFSNVKIGSASADASVPQPGLHIITLPSGDRRVSDQ
jgi:TolB protein